MAYIPKYRPKSADPCFKHKLRSPGTYFSGIYTPVGLND